MVKAEKFRQGLIFEPSIHPIKIRVHMDAMQIYPR